MAVIGDLLTKLGLDTSGLMSGVEKANSALKSVQKEADGTSNKFSALGKHLKGLSASLGLAWLGKESIDAATSYEEAHRIIQNSTGASGERLKALTAAFDSLNLKTVASSTEVATAMSMISSRMGITGKSLETVTAGMLGVAKVARTDVASIAPLMTRVFGDWSISVEKSSGAMKYLTSISQQTGVAIPQMLERIVQYGAPMRQLGFSFEQSSALMAKFEKEGVNVETAMAGMRKAVASFVKEGIDPKQGFLALMQGMKDGSVTTAQAMTIFGTKAGPDLLAAFKEGRFDEFLTGQLQRVATAAMNSTAAPKSIATEWKLMKKEVEASLVPIGEELVGAIRLSLPWLKEMLGNITGLVKSFAGLPDWAKSITIGLVGITAVATPACMAIGSISTAMGVLSAASAPVLAVLAPIIVILSALAYHLWKVYDAWQKLREEMEATSGKQASEAINKRFHSTTQSMHLTNEELNKLNGKLKETNEPVNNLAGLLEGFGKKTKEAKDKSHAWFQSLELDMRSLATVDMWTKLDEQLKKYNQTLAAHGKLMASATTGKIDATDLENAIPKAPANGVPTSSPSPSLNTGIGVKDDWIKEWERRQQEIKDYGAEFEKLEDQYQKGIITEDVYNIGLDALSDKYKYASKQTTDFEKTTKQVGETQSKVMQQVSTSFNDVIKGISDCIIGGKSLGETFKGIGKNLADFFLRTVLEKALSPLKKAMEGFVTWMFSGKGFAGLADLGKDITGIFKGLTSTVNSTISSVSKLAGGGASAASSASGGASSIAGGAASGAMGMVSMVSGAVSAVSSVIGNFQMAGMNKSLDIIVSHTLQAAMTLRSIDVWLREALVAIHDRLVEFRNLGIRVFTTDAALAVSVEGGSLSGSGGRDINVNITTSGIYGGTAGINELCALIARNLKLQGV